MTPGKIARRSVLAMLGLAPASAVMADDFTRPGVPHLPVCDREQIAQTLERFAGLVREDKLLITGIDFTSKIEPDELVQHMMDVKFICNDPEKKP